jgi:hypothetical protein
MAQTRGNVFPAHYRGGENRIRRTENRADEERLQPAKAHNKTAHDRSEHQGER